MELKEGRKVPIYLGGAENVLLRRESLFRESKGCPIEEGVPI
jgi:hypothetical protein